MSIKMKPLVSWSLSRRELTNCHVIYATLRTEVNNEFVLREFVARILGFKRENNTYFVVLDTNTTHDTKVKYVLGPPSLEFVLESSDSKNYYSQLFNNLKGLKESSVLIL